MTISERIFEEMKKKKITQQALANALGTKQSTVASWKRLGTQPSSNLIIPISKILDVSIEYLLIGQESEREYYTEDERKLITVYRGTNETGKLRIVEYAREMNQLHPEQEEGQQNLSASKIS